MPQLKMKGWQVTLPGLGSVLVVPFVLPYGRKGDRADGICVNECRPHQLSMESCRQPMAAIKSNPDGLAEKK